MISSDIELTVNTSVDSTLIKFKEQGAEIPLEATFLSQIASWIYIFLASQMAKYQ